MFTSGKFTVGFLTIIVTLSFGLLCLNSKLLVILKDLKLKIPVLLLTYGLISFLFGRSLPSITSNF